MATEHSALHKSPKFSLRARLRSFVYAGGGIVSFFRFEHNAQLHLVATVLVIIVSMVLGVSKAEAIAIIFSIALVWITEMINTAIEKAMDFQTLEIHPLIKQIKDLAAGAVLVAALAAVVVGSVIFIPKLLAL